MAAGSEVTSDGLPPLRDVVARHGLEPKRSLGQNFLFDLNLTARIARTAGPLAGVTVVEVGPGPGGLTRALLAQGAERVVAIEQDSRCLAALAEVAAHYPGRLEVIEGDALTVDPSAYAVPGRPLRIVANLPYNVGTALLTGWLETEPWPPWFDRMVLMFQREVAERIVATPAQRVDYGRLGVLCGWRTKARIQFDVPASAFTPPPKITSSIVELVPRPDPLPCRAGALSAVTQAAFGQRRKMLRQSLKALPGLQPADLQPMLDAAAVDGTRRAEELTIADFVAMASWWDERRINARP
ncbi:16S rRNA (adenine(1518)-N(6)/adenine(1519)-N(6))-dimethyltransferase RsmA [Lichenihabitans sp. Uapishka_5]|uniref:16S rRNA (adenine(1518)-N(6)/adenine(1519)-N(6))- dimethyltransferase RsmA n=1 Tax=Lichenihabitans sp. Uapishka_5 TaxID=3037302 RepID=UPI0029E7E756|nr:16S rRNA (adenine(1518)-N(6)/adenine(1519)-N(6))-dimethyltransferase RsmA [Lichenihabitans sp. Uapishka_5]MDX7950932.1 16S rRNA (adenine(1518)-N(6)/adenine(1519)-N(6))-dimethyltransferase RsmA [Lichenihabitans sp. Uapishka_5]